MSHKSGTAMQKGGQANILVPGNDELNRLTVNHETFKLTWPIKELVQAPVDLQSEGKRLLDQAGADGLWMMDVRSIYPGNEYVVTDVAAEQFFPKDHPSDISFVKQDMNVDFPPEWSKTFDLVHSRLVLAGCQGKIKEVFLRQLDLVRPGGWLQMEEMEMQSSKWNATPIYTQLLEAIRTMIGMMNGVDDIDFREMIQGWMNEAGMENIEVKFFDCPVGKSIAKFDPVLAKMGIAASLGLTEQMISGAKQMQPEGSRMFSKQDYETYLGASARDMKANESWFSFFCIYGQKPIA